MYWFDLAATHYVVILIEGMVIGYVLKYVVDALYAHFTSRRAQKVNNAESMMEEMFWEGASAQCNISEEADNDQPLAEITEKNSKRSN